VHTRVDRLPFRPLELACRQLVLAAHGKCLKADILPLNKKQVSDKAEKRKKARRAAAAEQQTQISITNAAAGVSVEAATDASDGVSSSMDDSDAVAASAGARLSLLSPVVPLGLARSQPDDLWPRWRLRCGRNGSGLTPHAPN
jgi:hypothetical protein